LLRAEKEEMMTDPAPVSAPQADSPPSLLRWMDTPWPWLVYLPFFALPYLGKAPSSLQAWGAALGIGLFLILYIGGFRLTGRPLIGVALAILALAFALAFTGGTWFVIAVYAAAMLGDHRPVRQAAWLMGLFAGLTGAYAALIGQLFPWGLIGMFMMGMAGFGSLSSRVMRDKNDALARAQEQVKTLAATAERERIGRDLHDLLGRTLTLVAMKADLANRLMTRDPARAQAEMQDVASAARTALAEVRAAVSGMTGASLVREIEQSRLALEAAGITCTVDGDAAEVAAGPGAILAMTLREAVTNVIRHSGARRCTIRLDHGNGRYHLVVGDDGVGIAVRESGGLRGLKARLLAVGGDLDIEGSGQGTRLLASLPVAA
jgi:two-component system, NarL family, sensor histidine kinase DesK